MTKNSSLDFERDLTLSQFTLESLQEAVFWVNEHGEILHVNATACTITG